MTHMPLGSLALAAAALVAGLLTFGNAQATPATSSAPLPTTQTAQDANIQPASHRYYRPRGNRYRYWGGNRYRYWGGGQRYWGPGSGLYLGFGFAPYAYGYAPYYRPYNYRPYYASRGNAHVRWCLNRYRSYDPRSNTFLGYDGDRHRCKSPYRY